MEFFIFMAIVVMVGMAIGVWYSEARKAKKTNETPAEITEIKEAFKVESFDFRVAGISFYADDIVDKLGQYNDAYDFTKLELIDNGSIYDPYDLAGFKGREYQYIFPANSDLAFVDEPNNELDPKALRVEADGTTVGYIKKGSTTRVRNLLKSPNFDHADIFISGGKFKIIYENYDEDDYDMESPKYTLESGEVSFFAVVTIYIKHKL